MQDKAIIKVAALLGAAAVGLGAFGAHGLKQLADPATIGIFETAVRYHFYHVFALLAVGVLSHLFPKNAKTLSRSASLFLAGIFVFSGSLYLLTASKVMGWGLNWLGAITPIGGVCLIGGWVMLFIAMNRRD